MDGFADDDLEDFGEPSAPCPGRLTLALLEDVATVLHRHGYPPVRGYALAELAASLYRPDHRPWTLSG